MKADAAVGGVCVCVFVYATVIMGSRAMNKQFILTDMTRCFFLTRCAQQTHTIASVQSRSSD
jgi:hypothetical protein